MGRNLFNFISLFSVLGSQSCHSTTPGPAKALFLWLTHSRVSLIFGGMVETKQSPDRWELWQMVGGRGRVAVLAEAPGRGVTLAAACCNVGTLSQPFCHSAFSWEREKEKGMEFKGVTVLV